MLLADLINFSLNLLENKCLTEYCFFEFDENVLVNDVGKTEVQILIGHNLR